MKPGSSQKNPHDQLDRRRFIQARCRLRRDSGCCLRRTRRRIKRDVRRQSSWRTASRAPGNGN